MLFLRNFILKATEIPQVLLKTVLEIFKIGLRLSIVIRNGKIAWKHGLYCWYELETFWEVVQRLHQNSKKWWLLWGLAHSKWPWGCFTHFLLLWLWCQRFWGSLEDRFRSKRLSQMLSCVIVCWIAKIYQSIKLKKVGYLLTRTRPA